MLRGSDIITAPAIIVAWLAAFLLTAYPCTSFAAADDAAVLSPDRLKSMSLEELMAVQITSVSRRPENLSDAASAIQVITGEDIRRSGATSLPEALRLVSNLHVAQKGAHSWGITARGFNTDLANKLLVMIDGRTVYTPLFSGVFWERQDYFIEDVSRIEVISGPGGALWGANAVNGVINIMSKSASDTQGLYLEGGGGTELRSFAGARYGGKLSSDVQYRVYGKIFDGDSARFSDGSDASDSWHMGQGGFRIDSEHSPDDRLTLQGDFFTSDQDLTTGSVAEVAGGNLLARWSHDFSEDSEMILQLYSDRTHLKLPTAPLVINTIPFAPAGTFEDDLDTHDLDFQHRLHVGPRNQVVWGLGYRFTHDAVDNSPGLGFLPTTLKQSLFSGFLQDEIALVLDKLSLTLGTKVEHNDDTGFEVEPSARLQWFLSDDQMIWGAVSRAIRAPSRIDRDLSQPTPPFPVLLRGDSDFGSEILTAYELGHRAQPATNVTTSIAAFYNKYDEIRSTGITPVTILPFFFQNNLEGRTYGLELSATYGLSDWWRLTGGYTLLKSDIRIRSGQMDFNDARNETADPEHLISLRSSMDLAPNVELDTALRWVDTLHNNSGPVEGTVPSYLELDVRLAWRPTERLEFSIVGRNLLDNQHPEYGFPSATREEIERSAYGKVTWRFR